MIVRMANDISTAPAGQDQAPPVTIGERLAGAAGVITAAAIFLICLDMALGGQLSAQVTARLPAPAGEAGGCDC